MTLGLSGERASEYKSICGGRGPEDIRRVLRLTPNPKLGPKPKVPHRAPNSSGFHDFLALVGKFGTALNWRRPSPNEPADCRFTSPQLWSPRVLVEMSLKSILGKLSYNDEVSHSFRLITFLSCWQALPYTMVRRYSLDLGTRPQITC